MDSKILGAKRCIFLGIPANILIVLRIKLEAAWSKGELLPVIIFPSANCNAAPANTPSFPFPLLLAAIDAYRASFTTLRSSTVRFSSFINNSAR